MEEQKRSLVISWLPAVVCIGAIFFISSVDGNALPDLNRNGMDKIAHLIEFAVLAFLVMRALRRFWPRIDLVAACAATTALVVICGVMDEGRQLLIPHRTCSVFDFMFDFVGASLGMLVFTHLEEEREDEHKAGDTPVHIRKTT